MKNNGFIYNNAVKLTDFARAVGAEPIFQMPRELKDNAYKAITYRALSSNPGS